MRAKNTNRMRHFSSLLNEHWKRKQRLKTVCRRRRRKRASKVWIEERAEASMIDLFGARIEKELEENEKKRKKKKKKKKKEKVLSVSLSALARVLFVVFSVSLKQAKCQQALLQTDPRPTIYSGQVSFGLLLSAHSSLGAELSTSASYQVNSVLAHDEQQQQQQEQQQVVAHSANFNMSQLPAPSVDERANLNSSAWLDSSQEGETMMTSSSETKSRKNRQIFASSGRRQHQRQHDKSAHEAAQAAAAAAAAAAQAAATSACSQTNPNALYAGMGAIWASHQANLVGDSQLAIGTYVYDSCNDLDVGQRQSVRIVSNLNAFQQTTCESPRGAPISLTIAHGDNQLRAIQLLTSFKVPVITSKEHFDLEDYSQLSREQKRYLFTTAPSSRHLAVGALRFAKRIVKRSTSSPKLPNHFFKMSPKNGLIVISRNLPARFIAYLVEIIPNHVNYEMLQSNQPIDQIRSIDALESILIKSSSSSSSSSSSGSSSESRIEEQIVKAPPGGSERRRKKRSSDESDSSSGQDSEYEASEADGKMLSPTILMFITPSEAIDLVTRLRNDLAEVSRYYSLIVTTREDISPALKTIFHRGGSRLCSGKAFYTISPKPDDISEFSRYFRDTVQMEGETSDHPLICEFAKFQTDTRSQADLDEISTEPVIKAVWAAASAFKSVYNRECGSLSNRANSTPSSSLSSSSSASASSQSMSNLYRAGGSSSMPESEPSGEGVNSGRVMASGRRSESSSAANKQQAHTECMVRMNKNMAQLVQRALRRLDASINSTGLQSLDGFKIRFDDQNELMTNKFSIKYINKECEITEMGAYSGLKESQLKIEEDALIKSLESTLPEAWPARPPPPPAPAPARPAPPPAASSASSPSTDSSLSSGSSGSNNDGGVSSNGKDSSGVGGDNSDSSSSSDAGAESPAASNPARGRRKLNSKSDTSDSSTSPASSSSSTSDSDGKSDADEETSSDSDKSDTDSDNAAPKTRTSKRSRISEAASNERMSRRRLESAAAAAAARKKSRKKKDRLTAAPVTAMSGGRGIMPGLTDTTEPASGELGGDRAASASKLVGESGSELYVTTKPTMRKLKPFPTNTFGSTLKDWLPQGVVSSTTTSTTASSSPTNAGLLSAKESLVQPTRVPSLGSRVHDDEQVDPAGGTSSTMNTDLKTRGTTQAPVYSTLPESGGNADLDLPPSTSKSTSSTSAPSGGAQQQTSTNTHSRVTKSTSSQDSSQSTNKVGTTTKAALDTAESTDYVTSPSISKNSFEQHYHASSLPPSRLKSHLSSFNYDPLMNGSSASNGRLVHTEPNDHTDSNRVNYFKDLALAPIPLSAHTHSSNGRQTEPHSPLSDSQRDSRSTLRSEQLQATLTHS